VADVGAGSAGPERIVVIDDDHAIRISCRQILARSGFEVATFEDGAAGLAGIAEIDPALVVVDLKMPGLSGLDVIERVRDIDPEIVLVVITGYATINTAVDAMRSGAYDFLPKPFKPDELRMIVDRGLERRRLRRKSRELEMARELMKRRFVSFVSHQLKSPLAAIHQYLDTLQRLDDTPEVAARRRQWIKRCLVRTEGLQKLIDDWLTLSRAEGAGLVGRRERVDLKPVLEGVVASYDERARAAGLTLTAELPDPALPVVGDRTCLTVLFDNLVTNALDYNRPGGSVTVSASQTGGEVVVEVRDTGVGIPEEALGLLFEEFYRVGPGPSGSPGDGPAPSAGGTGLGLPICRRIASELGGLIEVRSEVDVGSTFVVRLPAHPTSGEPEVEPGVAESEVPA
jgi:signal transduction histidine kinase